MERTGIEPVTSGLQRVGRASPPVPVNLQKALQVGDFRATFVHPISPLFPSATCQRLAKNLAREEGVDVIPPKTFASRPAFSGGGPLLPTAVGPRGRADMLAGCRKRRSRRRQACERWRESRVKA